MGPNSQPSSQRKNEPYPVALCAIVPGGADTTAARRAESDIAGTVPDPGGTFTQPARIAPMFCTSMASSARSGCRPISPTSPVQDIDERGHWDEYQAAYQIALDRCSTAEAPWYVVPSDRKWYRNWAIGEMLRN